MISLIIERITLRKDQSIVKKMFEPDILLNGMQKSLMVSANKDKPSLYILLIQTLTLT